MYERIEELMREEEEASKCPTCGKQADESSSFKYFCSKCSLEFLDATNRCRSSIYNKNIEKPVASINKVESVDTNSLPKLTLWDRFKLWIHKWFYYLF